MSAMKDQPKNTMMTSEEYYNRENSLKESPLKIR